MHKTRFTYFLLFALLMLSTPLPSFAQISFSVQIAPPPLPVYEQPVIPQVGYMWTPGYWHWSDDNGYYWVPGTWVQPPMSGLLWTPGYWNWADNAYQFNQGYWGSQIGYYGGVNYGYGYGGEGFGGGEWRGGAFFYNSAVMNVGSNISNVYVNKTVIVNNSTTNNNVSYHGGTGGTTATPTSAELQAVHEKHIQPTAEQTQHQAIASNNIHMLAKNNGGKPAIAATSKAGDFSEKSAVPAKAAGGEVNPASLNATEKSMPHSEKVEPATAVHSKEPAMHESAPIAHPATPAEHESTNLSHPTAPIVHESAPLPHPAAPIAHESAPVIHQAAPAPHESVPVIHQVVPAPHPTAPPKKENK